MTGPRISTTFPAAPKIPTIDAATLRGSMRMLNEERSYKRVFLSDPEADATFSFP
jgi:hypothetical protein